MYVFIISVHVELIQYWKILTGAYQVKQFFSWWSTFAKCLNIHNIDLNLHFHVQHKIVYVISHYFFSMSLFILITTPASRKGKFCFPILDWSWSQIVIQSNWCWVSIEKTFNIGLLYFFRFPLKFDLWKHRPVYRPPSHLPSVSRVYRATPPHTHTPSITVYNSNPQTF